MAAFFRENIFFSLKKQGKELVKDRIRFPSALSPDCIFLRFSLMVPCMILEKVPSISVLSGAQNGKDYPLEHQT